MMKIYCDVIPFVHILIKQPPSLQPKAKRVPKEVLNFRGRVVGQLKSLSKLGIELVDGEWGKAGQDRVVADGLSSTLECMVLTELTRVSAVTSILDCIFFLKWKKTKVKLGA